MNSQTPFTDRDPLLGPFVAHIHARRDRYRALLREIAPTGGLLGEISQGHRYFGLNPEPDGTIRYREWAPAARGLFLVGDFNGWDRRAHPMERDAYGVWHLTLPAGALEPDARVKVHVLSDDPPRDRIPAYIRRVVQEPTRDFVGRYEPPTPPPPAWTPPPLDGGLRIYEAHVGMATEEERVGTYAEFARDVLPRIAALGYNAVQLMAVQEHPYYGSFGYHVGSFFAPASRSGSTADLKALIAEAHRLGLRVLMDLVHSHAVSNLLEGLGRFDGTGHQYFHDGPRGIHAAWDSRCFDYRVYEVRRFLLSNARYWIEEFGFDGFRFDGVTSMLYLDHGLERVFARYDDYYGVNVDEDALLYLQAANDLVHAVRPDAVTIAEDVSGMPGLARPTSEGGVGFDYRLAMGVPDFWIKTLKERRDETWSPGEIWFTLGNRRTDERHIGYVESHDQSIVGDQTLAFRLMDAAMYTGMARGPKSPVIARGMALHKVIRLLTFAVSGDGWLNFMGNEFGHPEWVDFPREGNGWSHHHARRQWSLADRADLLYSGLQAFDAALQRLDHDAHLLSSPPAELLVSREGWQLLVFHRAGRVFAVNLHPSASRTDLWIPVPERRDYRLALNSDAGAFDGDDRGQASAPFPWTQRRDGPGITIYLPSRTALVFEPV